MSCKAAAAAAAAGTLGLPELQGVCKGSIQQMAATVVRTLQQCWDAVSPGCTVVPNTVVLNQLERECRLLLAKHAAFHQLHNA
jgi:hypothetical protein